MTTIRQWQLRVEFARRLSGMYGREVPAYGALVDVSRSLIDEGLAFFAYHLRDDRPRHGRSSAQRRRAARPVLSGPQPAASAPELEVLQGRRRQ